MATWLRITVATAPLALLAVLSCGTNEAPAPSSSPCGAYFDAVFAKPCTGPRLPDDEAGRLRRRFEAICVGSMSLPGSGMTGDLLQACASAIVTGCGGPSSAAQACDVAGTLAGGAACNESFQCLSGSCFRSAPVGDAGLSTTCGQCQPLARLGEPCSGPCADGTCDYTKPTPTCVAVTRGDAGAACDGLSLQCSGGLYCTGSTCAPLPAAGAACGPNGECAPPTACVARTCALPGGVGAICGVDQDCAAGLGCSAATEACGEIQWAGAGQPCGGLTRCLVGDCAGDTMTCPTVLDDGQACSTGDLSTTCDTFAKCVGGACVAEDSVVCM